MDVSQTYQVKFLLNKSHFDNIHLLSVIPNCSLNLTQVNTR